LLQGWGDPSDLVQQTLLEAHHKLESFTGETTALFLGWLREILAHNMADVIRGRRRKKRDYRLERSLEAAFEESSDRLGLHLSVDDSSPSSNASKAEQLRLLADALEELPPDQRDAVTLHHLRGLTLDATADCMGKTRPAVAGLLRRGLKQLGSLLNARGLQ
jgi:RNA polymerase sigma-70 factor (ECF subfamily)